MPSKLTHTEYVSKVNRVHPKRRIQVLGVYSGMRNKIEHMCEYGHIWRVNPVNIVGFGAGCPTCARARTVSAHTKSTKQYKKEVKLIHGSTVRVLGEYQGVATPIEHICARSHTPEVWITTPNSVLTGSHCKKCGIQKSAASRTQSGDTYSVELRKKHRGKIIPVAAYSGAMTPIMHACSACGNKWKATPVNVLRGKRPCP